MENKNRKCCNNLPPEKTPNCSWIALSQTDLFSPLRKYWIDRYLQDTFTPCIVQTVLCTKRQNLQPRQVFIDNTSKNIHTDTLTISADMSHKGLRTCPMMGLFSHIPKFICLKKYFYTIRTSFF